MILIELANVNQVEEMHGLLSAELVNPDSLNEIKHCVENYPSFVAYDRRQLIVGLSYSFGAGNDVLWLHGMHVHKDYRNVKIGSELLKHTENRARVLGYTTMMLSNSMQYQGVDKRSAVPFYDDHGYRQIFETFNSPPTYIMIKEL